MSHSHVFNKVGLVLVQIEQEVFESAQPNRAPICLLTEELGLLDRTRLKVLVLSLYLRDQVLFEDGIYRVITPSDGLRPENERIDVAVARPALFLLFVQHAPLPAPRDVSFVPEFARKH